MLCAEKLYYAYLNLKGIIKLTWQLSSLTKIQNLNFVRHYFNEIIKSMFLYLTIVDAAFGWFNCFGDFDSKETVNDVL